MCKFFSKMSFGCREMTAIIFMLFLNTVFAAPIDDARKLGKNFLVECVLLTDAAKSGELFLGKKLDGAVLHQLAYMKLLMSLKLKTKELEVLEKNSLTKINSKSRQENIDQLGICLESQEIKPYLDYNFLFER